MSDELVEDKPIGGRPAFGRDLTVGSIPRHLIAFAAPMLVGNLFQTLYSFINAFWVGKFLGGDALAAITVSFPVVFLLAALANGMCTASTILISQHFGAKDMGAVRRVVSNSTVFFSMLGLLLLVAGEMLAPTILRWMGTPAEVQDIASNYLRIFLMGVPLSIGFYAMRSMLQGIGDSKTPLYFLAVSLALTAVLDPVLMFGWIRIGPFRLPALGLDGTAWATNIAQATTLLALLAWLRKRKNLVAPYWGWRSFHWPTAWQTISIGAPAAAQQSLISLGMTFVMSIVNGFGAVATAAFGAGMRVDQLAFMPAFAIGLAVSPLSGQNIGAQKHHRVRGIFAWACLMSGSITAVVSIAVVVFARPILHLFVNDGPIMDRGADYLHTVAPCYVCLAIMFAAIGVINGSGHTLVATIISLVSQWVFRVPIAKMLSQYLGSVQGVWYAMGLSFAVSMVASLVYYLSGGWRKPVVRRHGAPAAPPPLPEEALAEETGEV